MKGELRSSAGADLFPAIARSLFARKHSSTYKYCILKCILDSLFLTDGSLRIPLAAFERAFAAVYWNLISVHHVSQTSASPGKPLSGIEKEIAQMTEKSRFYPTSPLTRWPRPCKKLLKEGPSPFSFITFLARSMATREGFCLGFSKRGERIWLSGDSFRFLSENKVMLDQVNYYEWLKKCEAIL